MAVVIVKIFCEECDVEQVEKEIEDWYYSYTSIGMNGIKIEVE